MVIAAFFFGGACALGLFAWALGKMIHTVHPIDEEPMPGEPPSDLSIELHRDVHSTRWIA